MPDTVPSAGDKFAAALTTLYRRLSVQFDAVGTALLTWLLSVSDAQQAEFLSHFGLKAYMIPPALFIGRALFTATPQPKLQQDTQAKAEAKAEAKAPA